MPNWCDNQVTITGPNSVIDKIEKIVKDEKEDNGLLQFMFPMPKALKDTVAGPEPKTKKEKLEKARLIGTHFHMNHIQNLFLKNKF